MPGFCYYLPDVHQQHVSHSLLFQFGLTHIDDDSPLRHRQILRGVDGKPGLLVGHSANWEFETLKFSDSLQWKAFPKSHAQKQAYCGYDPSQPLPGPEDLVRKKTLEGEYLTASDGKKWLIPTARKVSDEGTYCNLPMAYDLDEDSGALLPTAVQRQYAKLWSHVENYQKALMKAIDEAGDSLDSVRFQIPDYEHIMVDAFTANYRVSARELTILQVLVSGLVSELCDILTGVAEYERKKKEQVQSTGNT